MKKKIAISIDEDIYIKISEIAKDEDRSISYMINKILKNNLNKPAKK